MYGAIMSKAKKRTCISVSLKAEDADVESFLERQVVKFKTAHGITMSLSQVVIGNLRKQMEVEEA